MSGISKPYHSQKKQGPKYPFSKLSHNANICNSAFCQSNSAPIETPLAKACGKYLTNSPP